LWRNPRFDRPKAGMAVANSNPFRIVHTAVMSVESSESAGWWAAAAAGRLWRAPLSAAIGTAVVLAVVRLMQGTGEEPGVLSTSLAAGVAAGFVVALGLFRVLRPAGRRPAGDTEAFATLGLPVLAAVPEMVTGRERHAHALGRRRLRILSAVMIALSALGAAVAVAGLL
jgi:hypothetical protein